MGGGLFLGSTTLVVGITGSGKSVMALQYVAEGARRGERSIMLTLDEPRAQVLRNAATIGIDLKPSIDRGLVRLVYDRPQEIEIDRHFLEHREDREGVRAPARGHRQPVHLRLEPGDRPGGAFATSSTPSWRS